jgi:phosphoribosylaminoimidazole-succinocarboxamide synthase
VVLHSKNGVDMTVALFPASLDPVTSGHTALINYAVANDIGFDGKLVVVLGKNVDKGLGLFDRDVRRRLLELSLDKSIRPFVEIVDVEEVDEKEIFARYKPNKIIRGIRNPDDIKHELNIARRWRQAHGEIFGNNARTVWHDCPPELEDVNATVTRDAIIGRNGKDLANLDHYMAKPCAELLRKVLQANPAARKDRALLNQVVRNALVVQQNQKVGTPEAWDAIAAHCASLPPTLEGESKKLWQISPAQLAAYGIHHSEPVCIVKLKPTVYSYTGKRDEIIPGTEKLRLKATEVMWNWLKEAGIDVPVHHTGSDYYAMDLVEAPPIEVVVKAAHVGTPKHRLYGTNLHKTRTGEVIANDQAHKPYVRFDWRNPKNNPENGQALADECIPTELADKYIDTRIATATARNAFACLQGNLAARGVELQDICFFIAQNGFSLFSEVSPDGLRAKWLHSDLDKDAFRKGNTRAEVIKAYALLVGLIEGEPKPHRPEDKAAIIDRVIKRYQLTL